MNFKEKKKLYIFIWLFSLNFSWESLHAPLYLEHTQFISQLPILILASISDALWIIFLTILIDKIWLSLNIKRSKLNYLIIITTVSAIFIELFAIKFELWHYTMNIPTLFGVGISPVLQLPTTLLIYEFYHISLRKYVV